MAARLKPSDPLTGLVLARALALTMAVYSTVGYLIWRAFQ